MLCECFCCWEPCAVVLHRCILLHVAYVFTFRRGGLEALPWHTASREEDHHVAQAFYVITTTRTPPKMGIDACIPRCAIESFAFFHRAVLHGLLVSVALPHAEINEEQVFSMIPWSR